MEHIVIEGGIVLACPLAVWRKRYLQQLGLHRRRVDHNVDSVDCPAFLVMHLGVFGRHRDEHVTQHLFYLLVYKRPLDFVVLLELLNEVLVFYLLEVRHFAVVHHCELGLIS